MQNQKNVLLIIDSHEPVRKMLKRILGPYFYDVITTSDLVEAIYQSREQKITHLVSAFEFGKKSANGFEIATYFRHLHTSIEKAVIYTGADIGLLDKPKEVDAVIPKPDGIEALISALCWKRR